MDGGELLDQWPTYERHTTDGRGTDLNTEDLKSIDWEDQTVNDFVILLSKGTWVGETVLINKTKLLTY